MAKKKIEKAGTDKKAIAKKSVEKSQKTTKEPVTSVEIHNIDSEIKKKLPARSERSVKDDNTSSFNVLLNTKGNKTYNIIFAVTPALLVFAYLVFVWTTPEKRVTDDWYAAFELIQQSFQEGLAPEQKQQLLDSGGNWLQELSWKYPRHARVHYMTGVYFAIKGQYDSAVYHQKIAIHYGQGAIVNQVDHIAREELVRATAALTQDLMRNGDMDKTKKILWESLHYAPQSSDLLNNMAIISNNSGNPDSTIHYFDISLRINPAQDEIKKNLAYVCMNYGNNLLNSSRFNEAIIIYEKGVAHIKDNVSLYANLGRAYMMTEQKEKAKENFNRALQIDPNHAFSKTYLSQLQ